MKADRLRSPADELVVSNADAVTLLLVAATDYHGGDPATACDRYMEDAVKTLRTLKTDHLADHENLFRRVELEMAPATDASAIESLPIDERIARGSKARTIPDSPLSTTNLADTC